MTPVPMGSARSPEQAVESLQSRLSGLSHRLRGEDLRREVVRSLESTLADLRRASAPGSGKDPRPPADGDDEDFWIAM